MSTYEKMRQKVRAFAKEKYGSASAMAKELGLNQPRITRWLREEDPTVPQADMVFKVLDDMNAEVIYGQEVKTLDRPVSFIQPQNAASISEGIEPVPDNYRAIPLTRSDIAAGPGLIPEDEIDGWCLLWSHIPALINRTNLICSRIGNGQRSMVPLLHPEDYIVVDRDDKQVADNHTGNVFLIRDPYDGIAVKRVRFTRKGEKRFLLIYSENPEFPPDLLDIDADYDGDPSRAIIGRVVYSWTSLLNK